MSPQHRDLARRGASPLTLDDAARRHSDFPYHWGIDDLVPTSPENEPQLCLGVQFDICMHDWTRDNGAEIIKPGSHTLNRGPPEEWGLAGEYKQGETELYEGEEACYVEAVAGSVVLYDARTWSVTRPNPSRDL